MGGFQAVKSVSFDIPKGEFLVLIGPSGSGKSTTMKMINRMEPHTSGKITINGKDTNSYNASIYDGTSAMSFSKSVFSPIIQSKKTLQ